MAFTQKSKFTSSGLMNRMPNKAKLINNSKTAFHQQDDPEFVATESKEVQYGPDAGKDVVTGGYIAGKPGTVSGPRGGYEETFESITPEQMSKVTADGFSANLEGYKKYVDGFNSGTLPSQRRNFEGNVTNTDPTSGNETPSYTYEGTPRNIDPKWSKHYGFKEFTSETPTWKEQQDKLKGSRKFRNFSSGKQKKVMEAYKKSFLEINPDAKLTNKKSSTTRTLNKSNGASGTSEITGLKEVN